MADTPAQATDLREICWNAIKDSVLTDRTSYMAQLQGWTLTPCYGNGELAGVLLNKGAEIHLTKLGKHLITRAHIRETVGRVIETYGEATTRIPHTYLAGRRFVRRMGFVFTGSNQFDHFYTLKRLRHV